MGWLKLTQTEQRIILREAERAKNLCFSTLELKFVNSFLDAETISFGPDKDQFRCEVRGEQKTALQTHTSGG